MSDPKHSHQTQVLAIQLQILAGQSGQENWRFTSKYPNSRISVGSDAYCHWQLRAAGVAPVHFELSWDGQVLWISEVSKPDAVYLNGHEVSGWTQVESGAHLRFGNAELSATTTHVSEGDPPDADGEFPSEATQFVQHPQASAPRAQASGEPPPRMLSARTVVVRADQPGPAATPAPPAARPTLQTAVPVVQRYGLHEAKTMLHHSVGALAPQPQPHAAPMQAAPAGEQKAFPQRNSMFMYPPSLPVKDATEQEEPWNMERIKKEARIFLDKAKSKLKTFDLKTWVILGATLAMAGMFIFDSRDETPTPITPTVQQVQGKVEVEAPKDRRPPAELIEPKELDKIERDAANFYSAGSYREAHALYRRLARTLPEQRAFALMVDLLERQIKNQCAQQGGLACDD